MIVMKDEIKYLKPRICKILALDLNSKGTGFFIDNSGLLVTNFHVISRINPNGSVYTGFSVGSKAIWKWHRMSQFINK